MDVGTDFAAGNKKWIEDGIRYDKDRKQGLVGSKGEILRLQRPLQQHLHSPASPRKYLERLGERKLTMEEYVRFKVTRLIRGQEPSALNIEGSAPQEESQDVHRGIVQTQELFRAYPNANVKQNKLTYGESMKYIEKIQRPQQEIKSRPVTNAMVPKLHGFSPRLSTFGRRTDNDSYRFASSDRASTKATL